MAAPTTAPSIFVEMLGSDPTSGTMDPTTYSVRVQFNGPHGRWRNTARRRYRNFVSLRQSMQEGHAGLPQLPPKGLPWKERLSPTFMADREAGLRKFLAAAILADPRACSQDLRDFLGLPRGRLASTLLASLKDVDGLLSGICQPEPDVLGDAFKLELSTGEVDAAMCHVLAGENVEGDSDDNAEDDDSVQVHPAMDFPVPTNLDFENPEALLSALAALRARNAALEVENKGLRGEMA